MIYLATIYFGRAKIPEMNHRVPRAALPKPKEIDPSIRF